uniref:Uncharacterized protein n=1 Tax=Pithovirus LCPAC001 TaxID=2506585 RepID=A0A481Z2Q2_9VIRU|nr:MAG: hypothetical protein LCPAC001_01110 [Pithovirus LCPAC001]
MKMTSVPIDYFETDKLAQVKNKWYNTKTHVTEIVFGNNKYTILGVLPMPQYIGTTTPNIITPTFEEKLYKWECVLLYHREKSTNKLIAMHPIKINQ